MEEDKELDEEIKRDLEEEPKKSSKQFYWILGIMGGAILGFLLVMYIANSMKTFEFNGLMFTKEYFGDISVYRYSYNALVPLTGNVVGTRPIHLFLRGDPRNNEVPLNGGEIAFPRNETIYIAINGTGLTGCEYASVGIASLSGFLASNNFKVKGATLDKNEANESNVTYASCESNPENPVIEVKSGIENKVEINGNCYLIEIANCGGILPTLEKFEVQIVLDAKARAD